MRGALASTLHRRFPESRLSLVWGLYVAPHPRVGPSDVQSDYSPRAPASILGRSECAPWSACSQSIPQIVSYLEHLPAACPGVPTRQSRRAVPECPIQNISHISCHTLSYTNNRIQFPPQALKATKYAEVHPTQISGRLYQYAVYRTVYQQFLSFRAGTFEVQPKSRHRSNHE